MFFTLSMKSVFLNFLFFVAFISSGQNFNDENYDFLSHPYKYLDDDYNIIMDTQTFENAIANKGFYKVE